VTRLLTKKYTKMQTAINCRTATPEQLKEAFYNGTPISGITTVATHFSPHNDELCGKFFLMKTPHGKRRFPGIENAIFGPISITMLRNKNRLGEEGFFRALQSGILLIGIGGGPLDEHSDRRTGISCAERIAQLIDLMSEKDDRKIYGSLLQYVNFEDNNGDNLIQCLQRARGDQAPRLERQEVNALRMLQTGGLAQNLKKGFEVAGEDVEIMKRVCLMADIFYETEIEQAKLFLAAEKAYDKNEHLVDLRIPSNKNKFVLLELKSDNILMNKVVHSKWRDNREKKLGVLFLHKSNGQFVLMPNEQHITVNQMKEIVKVLRQKTMQKGYIGFGELCANGSIDSVPSIHFDEARGIIANGSKTDPEVPGLIGKVLSVEDVIEAVQIGLDTEFFAPEFAKGCRIGKCAGSRCWMFKYGQKRCFQIRDNDKIANSQIGQAMKNGAKCS
jgi:hypothetical protein